MPITEHARRYLLNEGLKPDTIIKTGSPMKEILEYYMPKIEKSNVLKKLNLTRNEYFIVSTHREENIDYQDNFDNLLESLVEIANVFEKRIIVSTHPRTMKKLVNINKLNVNKLIEFMKPMGLFDYVKLQMNAYCVVSDSGTVTEESSILNFPAITIRQAHERPEGMDEGTLIMSGLKKNNVIDAIKVAVAHSSDIERRFKIVQDYDVDNFSKKVLKLIFSYCDYINRTVWHK